MRLTTLGRALTATYRARLDWSCAAAVLLVVITALYRRVMGG